ncbi:MAG: hemolysin III family protein [Myxococcota bacterium]
MSLSNADDKATLDAMPHAASSAARVPGSWPYTPIEEWRHALTHGVTAALAVAGLFALLIRARERAGSGVAFGVYGLALILVFSSSAIYHRFSHTKAHRWLEFCDHTAIFIMIAGTYTPIVALGLPEPLRGRMLILMWGFAAGGIAFKTFSFAKGFEDKLRTVSVLLYLIMGWLGLSILPALIRHLSPNALLWLGVGGVLYTIGALIYSMRRIPHGHLIWHLFVMGASACHFVAIFAYLI